jgi:transcriptional regulator with XRE-family HTH domain
MDALGIFGVEQSAYLPSQTIENPQTIGEHLRKRRLELKITQKSVANIIGVSEDSITYWENERSSPQIRFYPKLIEFLGYNPFPFEKETLGGKIKKYRIENGLSIKRLAEAFGIEGRILVLWEENKIVPKITKYQKLRELMS